MSDNGAGHGGRRVGAGRKAGPTANANERYTAARAAKEEALARIRNMEADEAERRLILATEVEATIALAFSSVAQSLLNLPDQLERQHGLDADVVQSVEATIHQMMDNLADQLQSLGTIER